ncbi:MAG: undecaprenyldiphospho-muramoylpentapeptide beta-N-acetylglucosaminyltransferase [Deltaproteobacteria bacterium]|nr:undecaprenyldiphospho-muramoylpentapeptide beta-N-acetylglucosaminyltransferase [Deltaproteobacteria bacterium]
MGECRMIIAGGGTGGHLFPGIAVAEELLKRNPKNAVLFIGTERGLENRILRELGYELRLLDVEGVKGRGIMKAAQAVLKIPKSMMASLKIIRDFRPDIVMGVGGYVSGPSVITAHFMGIKTVVAEQNVIPGVTNRILGRFVDKIFITFSDTEKWISGKKAFMSGNPIRAGFMAENGASKEDNGRFNILVFGGSQGARAINRACMDALDHLGTMKDQLKFVHQTGKDDCEEVSRGYRTRGFDAVVLPFIMDMPAAYRSADLLICRAGATSIAELTACGKASVLIPFPYAIHDHQTKNAEVLVRAGAAEMIPETELSGPVLAHMIEDFKDNPDVIWAMEKKSFALGNKRAAADIVDECLRMIKK